MRCATFFLCLLFPLGTEGSEHWAFRRPFRTSPPEIRTTRVRTPVDAFVLAKLHERGLAFSSEADRNTLLRRVRLDLLGLPPSPDEVQEFLADRRPDAYERLVDRLLSSRHFGERWGRHWLDAAGYVDVTGGDNDAGTIKLGKGKWRYRDYVIEAYNEDKPFDRFLTEQLAGDELVDWRSAGTFTPEMRALLVATGFLRVSADDTDENELNTLDIRFGVLHRTGEIVASNLLALTLNCAKCHDHKYDPISQRDYYGLMAIFNPVFNPSHWLQPKHRELADVSPTERAAIEQRNAELDGEIQKLKAREKELAKAAGKAEAELASVRRRISRLAAQRRSWSPLQVAYDVAPPSETHLLRRGNYKTPGDVVPPRFPGILIESSAESFAASLGATRPAGKSSGRRLALSHWLTRGETIAGGLVARVVVNRIWQRLFGVGLVPTSDNFGRSGARPTHPKLLDWLATELVRGGWRIKPLIRLIVTSEVYRQASIHSASTAAASEVDPANQLLWRMRLRRLDSEIVRDSILAVSGTLNRTMGGPPLPLDVRPDGRVLIKESGLPTPTSRWRRSVYVLARRNYHLSLLGIFDQPVVTTNCTARKPSAVVTQSLTLLNDSFVLEQAKHLAERVARTASGPSRRSRIRQAFQIVLGREPEPEEDRWCEDFLERRSPSPEALTHLCHMLLNTNEFLYVP